MAETQHSVLMHADETLFEDGSHGFSHGRHLVLQQHHVEEPASDAVAGHDSSRCRTASVTSGGSLAIPRSSLLRAVSPNTSQNRSRRERSGRRNSRRPSSKCRRNSPVLRYWPLLTSPSPSSWKLMPAREDWQHPQTAFHQCASMQSDVST